MIVYWVCGEWGCIGRQICGKLIKAITFCHCYCILLLFFVIVIVAVSADLLADRFVGS